MFLIGMTIISRKHWAVIIVDTGAWYAICGASDRDHDWAAKFYQQVAGTIALVTADIVLAETWTLLAASLGRLAAITFWDTIHESGTLLDRCNRQT